MKDLIQRSGFLSIGFSLVFLFLGIILLNNPEGTIRVASYVLGGLLIVFGIFRLVSYFSTRNNFQYYDYNLMLGTLCFLIGLVIVIFGTAIASIFGIILGIWVVLSAVNRINLAIKLKECKIKYWYVCLILALLVLVAGAYIVFNPEFIAATVGALLITYSVMDIVQSIIFIVNSKKIFGE